MEEKVGVTHLGHWLVVTYAYKALVSYQALIDCVVCSLAKWESAAQQKPARNQQLITTACSITIISLLPQHSYGVTKVKDSSK